MIAWVSTVFISQSWEHQVFPKNPVAFVLYLIGIGILGFFIGGKLFGRFHVAQIKYAADFADEDVMAIYESGNFTNDILRFGFSPASHKNKAPERMQALLRSMQLLVSKLTIMQRIRWYLFRNIVCYGGNTKKKYIIKTNYNLNILDVKTNVGICIVPENYVPMGDRLLAQKIMLESKDELKFLQDGNRVWFNDRTR